jgi:processive 1,2-diacylglycerol beta-glucosyltransferase
MKKILILYTSVGLGHKVIAENMGFYLVRGGYDVRLEDILEVQSGRLVSITTALHKFVNNRLPWLWKFLYTSKLFTDLTLPARVRVAGKNHIRTKKLIDEFNPDLVICTQTTASAILAYLKQQGMYKNLFAITFSDYHLHRYWLYEEADFYFANTDEQKTEMIALGINENKIFVCGITIQPKPEIDTVAVKQKFEIQDEQKVIVVASGSQGIGPSYSWYKNFIKEVLSLTSSWAVPPKIIVVCGQNKALHAQLSSVFVADNIIILGFHKPMAELHSISNLFVSKPGGLSFAESLLWCVPMLIYYVLPGQEEMNLPYLSGHKLVLPIATNLPMNPKSAANQAAGALQSGEFAKHLENSPDRLHLLGLESAPSLIEKAVNAMFHKV